ncbi:MAG TPA: 3-phosphoshikimate 1-carboxyvinyltransferase, partial [Geobacterales bacterium]|nr:3-phosphoshikimate 1-carboxyvinyltransferase [Geobacterales bacterium]
EIKGADFSLKKMPRQDKSYFYVGSSATCLRFLIPILCVIGGSYVIDGDDQLRKRPLNAIYEALFPYGILSSNMLPLKIEGRFKEDEIAIRGDESSQYISGFMFAFALKGGGKIKIINRLTSKSHVLMTKEVLEKFGVKVNMAENSIEVIRKEYVTQVKSEVEGDYLLSSFYVAGSLITTGSITIKGLPKPRSYFGDHSILEIYKRMGAVSEYSNGKWICNHSPSYKAVKVDIDDAPDIAVSIAALASVSEGITEMKNAMRLGIKESNRISSIIDVLKSFNVVAKFEDGSLSIEGLNKEKLNHAVVKSHDDHRIAMLASVLALVNGGIILGAESTAKSNPNFWEDLQRLGGKIKLEN